MPLIKPLGRALKKFYNKTPDFKNYWWITTSIPGEDSAEINLTNALANKDFNKLKSNCWKWFRDQIQRKDLTLSSREQIVLWALIERIRGKSFSVWCSYLYLSRMLNKDRKTIAKAINTLAELNVIWLVQEGREKVAMRSLPAQKRVKKHIILVGLNRYLGDPGEESQKKELHRGS